MGVICTTYYPANVVLIVLLTFPSQVLHFDSSPNYTSFISFSRDPDQFNIPSSSLRTLLYEKDVFYHSVSQAYSGKNPVAHNTSRTYDFLFISRMPWVVQYTRGNNPVSTSSTVTMEFLKYLAFPRGIISLITDYAPVQYFFHDVTEQ